MSTLLAGTLLLTATGLFSQVVGFVYRMILSRMIGAETMGLFQLVMPVFSVFMSLTAVGLTMAVSTLSARYHALEDDGAVKAVLRRALGCFFLLAVPLGIVVVALSDPISVYLLGDARTRLGVVLLVPCLLLTGVENLHKHCFYGIGRVRPPAAAETAEQVIRAGAVLGLLAALLPRTAEQTVGIVVLGMVLCEVFSACALTLLFQRHWKRFPPSPARDQVSRRRLFAIALPVGATSLLGNLLNCANSVLIPAQRVEVPDLSRRTAQGDRRAAAGVLDRVMSSTSLLMAPAMALLTVIGPSMGRAMFQDDRVGTLILPLAAGMLLGCWQSVLSGALNGLGLQNKAARSAIVSDAAQLAFTFFAVPKWGLPGFAAGFVVSGIVGAGMNLASVLRAAGLRPRLFRWFVRPVLAAVFMGLWCNLLFRVMLDAGCHQGWTALVCAILGLVLYAAALLAQGLSVNVVFAWFGSCFKQKGRAL